MYKQRFSTLPGLDITPQLHTQQLPPSFPVLISFNSPSPLKYELTEAF